MPNSDGDRIESAGPSGFASPWAWWRELLCIVLVGLAVTSIRLGQNHRWSSREARHASIAIGMKESGDLLLPRRFGRPYTHKPPVYHVLVTGCGAILGKISITTARLPSAAAGLLGAIGVWLLARRLVDPRVALFAALVLLATPGYVKVARTARPDMVFTALIIFATVFLVSAAAANRRSWRTALALLGGITAGAAVLTKGPYGILIPLLCGAFLHWSAARRRLALLDWLLFVAGGLLLPGAWAAALYWRGDGAFVNSVIFQDAILTGAGQHSRPIYWYLLPATLTLVPWSLLLGYVAVDFRRPRTPVLTAAAIFLVLSCVPGKRTHYLAPWYPFAVLAVGEAMLLRAGRQPLQRCLQVALVFALVAMPTYYAAVLPYRTTGDDPLYDAATKIVNALPVDSHVVGFRLSSPIETVAVVGEETGRLALSFIDDAMSAQNLRATVSRVSETRRQVYVLFAAHDTGMVTDALSSLELQEVLTLPRERDALTLARVSP